jgi:tetratricopeptide (TPR) repeat protein
VIGARESGTRRLEEAVAAYREALKGLTSDHDPLQWAQVRINLGAELSQLGERESDTKHFEESIKVYNEALQKLPRERVPLEWANIKNNLGCSLGVLGAREIARLGEQERGRKHLEEAVTTYNEALQERTRERVPLEWAETKSNLCADLRVLGATESGTKHIEEAVKACEEALQERTRERVPLDWANTQINLGMALMVLGERQSSVDLVCSALGKHYMAWEEASHMKATYIISMAKSAIQLDLSLLEIKFRPDAYKECVKKHMGPLIHVK